MLVQMCKVLIDTGQTAMQHVWVDHLMVVGLALDSCAIKVELAAVGTLACLDCAQYPYMSLLCTVTWLSTCMHGAVVASSLCYSLT